jgi:hypothetical protein
MWEVSELVSDIRFHTYIREHAGKFEFGLLKDAMERDGAA